MTQPLLSVWIPGKPKTKGSLEVVNARRGRSVVRESVVGSKRWRALMAYALGNAYDAPPLIGRVGVDAVFHLPVQDVTTAGAGDLDKLARNLLDAMQDAKIFSNDVQVAPLILDKVEADDVSLGPGVMVKVWQD